MKIGIVGPADRAVAWEKNLRPHRSVKEVIIAATLKDIGRVDACILLEESKDTLHNLLKAIRSGFHTFFVSELPTQRKEVEKAYHSAEEANVLLQFSHWPTFAPVSQWMAQKISKPTFIQINRDISHTQFLEMNYDLEFFWIDELALCMKWIDGAVHHIDLKKAALSSGKPYALHMFLRFDSGATANIFLNTASSDNRHQRLASDQSFIADCNVGTQSVRLGQENKNGHLFFEKKTFDASKAAEIATTQFLKAIQLKKRTLYNGYDLLKLATEIEKVKKRLERT